MTRSEQRRLLVLNHLLSGALVNSQAADLLGISEQGDTEREDAMKLTPLCEMELRYTWTDFVDFGSGGQYVGTMEGAVRGERLSGHVKFVNVPPKRPDNVNCPALRGILLTGDGAKIYVELDGIALLRKEDNARLFTTSVRMRTGDANYGWVNTSFGVLEGILNNTTDVARTQAFLCEHELETDPK